MLITGPLERSIMEALWDADRPLLIRELLVPVNMGSPKPSAYTTVQTVADRLVQKGFLSRTTDRNAWRYTPTCSREDHVAQIMAEALARAADRGPVLALFAKTIDSQDAHRLLMELARRSAPVDEDPRS